jgi:hypothetical protein
MWPPEASKVNGIYDEVTRNMNLSKLMSPSVRQNDVKFVCHFDAYVRRDRYVQEGALTEILEKVLKLSIPCISIPKYTLYYLN